MLKGHLCSAERRASLNSRSPPKKVTCSCCFGVHRPTAGLISFVFASYSVVLSVTGNHYAATPQIFPEQPRVSQGPEPMPPGPLVPLASRPGPPSPSPSCSCGAVVVLGFVDGTEGHVCCALLPPVGPRGHVQSEGWHLCRGLSGRLPCVRTAPPRAAGLPVPPPPRLCSSGYTGRDPSPILCGAPWASALMWLRGHVRVRLAL